jgi:hypothetical protein
VCRRDFERAGETSRRLEPMGKLDRKTIVFLAAATMGSEAS